MSLKTTARAYLRDAGNAFDRAPVEVALCVFTAVLLSYSIEDSHRFGAWPQIAVGAFLAFAFAWCSTLLTALGAITSRQRWVITGTGALLAAVYLLSIESIEREAEGWRAFMLVAGAALLLFAAPAWVRAADSANLRLRRINGRIILRTIGIGLYGGALFAGLALALTAVDTLFELQLEDEIYGHTFGWIMLVLVPWVIVGGLDSYVRSLDEESEVARVVHRLASFLVPPLLVLYYVILFVYAVRIAITGELPKNLVSPMVLAAGLLTALAAILFDPAPDDTRIGRRVLRFAPMLFLPLVPIGIWALAARIDDYGWTEFRMLRVIVLVVLAALALLATLQLSRRRAFALRVIPVVLGVTLLLSAVGPWSVLAVSRRDQQARLAATLRAAGIDVTRPLPHDTVRVPVSSEHFNRINNLGVYLETNFGPDAVAEVTGGAVGHLSHGSGLTEALQLTVTEPDTAPFVTMGALRPGSAVPLAIGTSYRIAIPSAHAAFDGTGITMVIAGEMLRADITPFLEQLPRGARRREQRDMPRIAAVVRDRSQAVRGELIILDATMERRRSATRILRLDGVLILRSR